MVVFVRNASAGISPDRTTALMAAQVIGNLAGFCEDAGVSWRSVRPDSTRFEKQIKETKKQTWARNARRMRMKAKRRV
jgi:hypothetical protein